MVWIGLIIIALFTGATVGFFATAMFIAGASAGRTAAKNVKDLPAVEPPHLAAVDGDAYLGEIASMVRRREPATRESAYATLTSSYEAGRDSQF